MTRRLVILSWHWTVWLRFWGLIIRAQKLWRGIWRWLKKKGGRRVVSSRHFRGPNDQRRRTLSGTIAHEITHFLIRRHVGGSRAEGRLPRWLKEGYCEFVCNCSAIDELEGLALLESGSSMPGFWNFKNRLVVDYLLKGKQIAIEELLQDPPDFDVALAEIKSGLGENGLDFLRKMDTNIGLRSPSSTSDESDQRP